MDRAQRSLSAVLFLRIGLIAAGLALLSACNVVLTKAPLFTAADETGAPPLRPGVWIFFTQPDCQVDESKPFTEWPDCAGGGLVAPGDIAGHDAKDPPGQLDHTPFVLAAGDPRIAQLRVAVDLSAGASTSADGQTSSSSSSAQAQPYGYAAVHPTKFDAQGRIVALTLWPVQCGPPPKNAKGEETTGATRKPLPGLEVKPGEVDCTTASKEVLRTAAKLSEAWVPSPGQAHWVRDAER